MLFARPGSPLGLWSCHAPLQFLCRGADRISQRTDLAAGLRDLHQSCAVAPTAPRCPHALEDV